MKIEDKLILSYTFYVFLMMIWLVLLWGATGYVVFFMGHIGWWCAFSLLLSCPIAPWKWNRLLTGIKPEEG